MQICESLKLDKDFLLYLPGNFIVEKLDGWYQGLRNLGGQFKNGLQVVLCSDIEPNTDLGLPPHHYFPVGDVDALAARLAEPHDSFNLASRAFLDEFDWDNIARKTLAIILGRGGQVSEFRPAAE